MESSDIMSDEEKRRLFFKEAEGWLANQPKCGCGRIGRYQTRSGLACNKYMRCDDAEYLANQNNQLRAELAALREQNRALVEMLTLIRLEVQLSKWIFSSGETLDDLVAQALAAVRSSDREPDSKEKP